MILYVFLELLFIGILYDNTLAFSLRSLSDVFMSKRVQQFPPSCTGFASLKSTFALMFSSASLPNGLFNKFWPSQLLMFCPVTVVPGVSYQALVGTLI
ncbi:hypothetical protein ACTXT7_004032 [Hymenolepis weldensis]